MKTSFRKEFNSFEENFNIEETTINEDLGIDPQKIRTNVFSQISAGKKRKNRKGFTIFLIAAVVSATVLGTTAIAATMTKKHTADFTDKYNGEVSILEVNEAKAFSFESADNDLQAEFLGIVSDGKKSIASVVITKKDGSEFVDEGMNILKPEGILLDEIKPLKELYQVENKDYLSEIRNMENKPDYQYVYYSLDNLDNIVEESTNSVEYILSDDRTELKMYIELTAGYGASSGGKGEISSEYINLCKYTNKIAQYNKMNDDNYFAAKSLCDAEGLDFYSDCKWVYKDGVYTLYQIEPVKYDLVYDMSFKMDFEVENSIQNVFTDTQAPDFLRKDSVMSMKMTPFSLTLNSSAAYTEEAVRAKVDEYCTISNYDDEMKKNVVIDFDNQTLEPMFGVSSVIYKYNEDNYKFSNIDYSNSRIVMKDGTAYYFLDKNNGSGINFNEEGKLEVTDDFEFAFSELPYDNSFGYGIIENEVKESVLDPQKVSAIIINGNTIYQAPDERTNTTRNAELDPLCETDINNRKLSALDEKYYRDFIFGTKTGFVDNQMLMEYDIYEGKYFSGQEGANAVTHAIFKIKGTKNQLLNVINNLIKDEENGLVIYTISITDKPDCFDEYIMELNLENYYIKDDPTLDEQAVLDYTSSWFRGQKLYTEALKHFNGKYTDDIVVIHTQPDYLNLRENINTYERNNGIVKHLKHDDVPGVVKEGHRITMNITPSKVLLHSEETTTMDIDKITDILYLGMEKPNTYDYNNSKVIMKDGTEYYLIFVNDHQEADNGFGRIDDADENDTEETDVTYEIILAYSKTPVNTSLMNTKELYDCALKVDTNEISKVIINGSEVYDSEQKGDNNDDE